MIKKGAINIYSCRKNIREVYFNYESTKNSNLEKSSLVNNLLSQNYLRINFHQLSGSLPHIHLAAVNQDLQSRVIVNCPVYFNLPGKCLESKRVVNVYIGFSFSQQCVWSCYGKSLITVETFKDFHLLHISINYEGNGT